MTPVPGGRILSSELLCASLLIKRREFQRKHAALITMSAPPPLLVRLIKVAHQALLNSFQRKSNNFPNSSYFPSTITQHWEQWFKTTKDQFFRETEHAGAVWREKKGWNKEFKVEASCINLPSQFMRAAQEIFLKTWREHRIPDTKGRVFWGYFSAGQVLQMTTDVLVETTAQPARIP